MTTVSKQNIEITLLKSPIATTPNQRANLKGLGLTRREKIVVLQDTPSVRGMIMKVIHLVDVCKATDAAKGKKVTASSVEVIPPKEPVAAPKKRAPSKKKEKKS
jgi:large subunit ribosomal protein L30